MASHHKQVAVVAESIHCLGHEREHYKYNTLVEQNLTSISARTTLQIAPET